MKKSRILLLATLLMASVAQLWAANTKTTVSQVKETVNVTDNVDYIVSAKTPFADNGVVNLVNTDHAVLILLGVKPSAAVPLLADHVQINGEKAVNTQNCQVKMYNRGCIILPYGNSVKPLTVYSEQNFEGKAVNSFGLENTGGFMNTLTAAKLNNQIRSFKLKRGYMVTFSTRASGRGYSRCYIAAYNDIEVAKLPVALDKTISSYRIFKWYDFSKAGIANDTRKAATDATNVQGCYSFGLGEDRGMDCECVPHHIYEDWPSATACGQVTYSPHLKTNNEPGNSADDRPQSVQTILDNWENLMATGMRLCSPSSHDGSLNHLREFLSAIDERGWRCDIIDMHCYWPEGSFGSLQGWYDTYKRPIWISEWVWGASWNSNGAFASGVTESQNAAAVKRIVTNLNSWSYIERYFYWNSERDPSKIYKDGKLTEAGTWYAQMNPGLGYQGVNYAPKVPEQKAVSNFKVAYDKTTQQARLTWYDANGEWNQDMHVERSTDGGNSWQTIANITQQEAAANYSYTDNDSRDGYQYRVYVLSLNNKDLYSSVQKCVIGDATTGDAVTVDGKSLYIGGNIILNGDFDMGLNGWTSGKGEALTWPCFQILPVGGADGGAHLMSWSNQGETTVGGLKTEFDVLPNTQYYFSVMLRNTGGVYQALNLSDGTPEVAFVTTKTSDWQLQAGSFNTGSHLKATVNFRWLDNAQVDKMMLCRLFESRDEAIQDALTQEQKRAQAIIDWNTQYPALNTTLAALIASASSVASGGSPAGTIEETLAALTEAIATTLQAIQNEPARQHRVAIDEALAAEGLTSLDDFQATSLVLNPNFSTNGNNWNTKSGTYKGGDQRQNTVAGKTCWNAWWSGLSATSTETMAIDQEVKNLPEGYYYLECQATTQHYCLSDQHGFLKTADGKKLLTPTLTYDRFDFTDLGIDEPVWETLTTLPVYVAEGGSLTVGFESSKQGAIDGAWRSVSSNNDKREGWWCATGFQLSQLPVYSRTAEQADTWGTLSLPYAIRPGQGVELYEVAGVLYEDGQLYICLDFIESQEAGVPCVYHSQQARALFLESGKAVSRPTTGRCGLYGAFGVNVLMSFIPGTVGSIVFDGTQWKELAESDFVDGVYQMPANTAYLSGGIDKLEVLSSWTGIKMPLTATATGIAPVAAGQSSVTRTYDLQGRPATPATRGLRIEQQGTTVRKVIK